MEQSDVDRVNELSSGITTKEAASKILNTDGQLTRKILEDWLINSLPGWFMFYDVLAENVPEGHLIGPSPHQANILRRMRDSGHRVAPVRGFLRWIGGNDERLTRRTAKLMIDRGWLRIISGSGIAGLEYMIIPTQAGMIALSNFELDKKDRPYP